MQARKVKGFHARTGLYADMQSKPAGSGFVKNTVTDALAYRHVECMARFTVSAK